MNTFTISDIKQEHNKAVIKTKDLIISSDKCVVGLIKDIDVEFSNFTFIFLWIVPKTASRFNASIYILDDDEYENCGNYIP